MTAVQRLPLLPAPGTTPAGQAGAVPGREEQQVRPVVPARYVQRGLQNPRESQIAAETQQIERRVADRRLRDREAAQSGLHAGSERRASGPAGEAGAKLTAPATGRSYGFSQFSSLPFLVQVLGQEGLNAGRLAPPQTTLTSHRDAAQLGSDIYRKSGGEPEFLPETATFVRLAI